MKKLKDISVRELLSIEDGFYKLETPIKFGGKELDSVECQLEYGDETPAVNTINITPSKTVAQLTVGNKYHVKLRFSSGFIAEKTLECIDDDGTPVILFDADMFDNLYTEQPCGISVGIGRLSGILALTTPQDENRVKYGDSVTITITEAGEISGVINISTDTKILDGVTKVITSLADDTSYYVDNIWQDGDALEVSAMDESAEGGGGSGGTTALVTFKNVGTGDYQLVLPTIDPSFADGATTMIITCKRLPTYVESSVVLFNGSAYIVVPTIQGIDTSVEPVVEGACQVRSKGEVSYLEITGDCTITLYGTGNI